MRGSGLEGLSGVPELRALGNGWVARPLLRISRAALRQFLVDRDQSWIEDSSNLNTQFDRNFLRQEILPRLQERWASPARALSRSAQHIKAARELMDSLLDEESGKSDRPPFHLSGKQLFRHDSSAAPIILRHWLRSHGAPSLPLSRLLEFLGQLSRPKADSKCLVEWEDWSMRLFRDDVHLIPPGALVEVPSLSWGSGPTLNLGPGCGSLALLGPEVNPAANWRVGPRQPGDKIRRSPSGTSNTLKDVFREYGIPPWQRPAVPVLYWDKSPVAIGDWLMTEKLQTWLSERQLEYRWRPEQAQLLELRNRCNSHHLDP